MLPRELMRRALLVALLVACSRKEPAADPPGKVELVAAAPFGDVAQQVRDARAEARPRGRRLLVYVGATWCEPCQRFHEAAQRGELDKDFPTLTLLEYDLDMDGARLQTAGYKPRYIPFIGVPAEDGRASSKAIEGSVKGDGAVGNIAPRLKELMR